MKSKLAASLKIWIVIYPSITLFLYMFGDVLAFIPLYIRTLILTATLVPWMVFVGLPCLNYIMKQCGFMKQKK
jgi:antibiotic biosynthesis monooxygenase (ABM) superfamily enzyme